MFILHFARVKVFLFFHFFLLLQFTLKLPIKSIKSKISKKTSKDLFVKILLEALSICYENGQKFFLYITMYMMHCDKLTDYIILLYLSNKQYRKLISRQHNNKHNRLLNIYISIPQFYNRMNITDNILQCLLFLSAKEFGRTY